MTKLAQSLLLAVIFSLTFASAAAQSLTGTVTNGTTGKPAAGDEVILINLANGMDVTANAKATRPGQVRLHARLVLVISPRRGLK